ncbi:peptidase dimerization domain-containing protein [Streptomyces sp. NPDC101160]|uniref:peptidase dimerization domain-containing protein n=1 Tax=Streptomyces sp. NPDC101160 TaxID=3366118 RepID=UPI00381056FE
MGPLHAGTEENVIPDTAELRVTIRSTTPAVRERVPAAVERIVRAEAAASGAPKDPEFAPVPGPTIPIGVTALLTAAGAWLGTGGGREKGADES